MQSVTFDSWITVIDPSGESDDEEVQVTVEADVTPGHPGSFYARNGDPGDPPEAPEVEITSITDGEKEYEYDDLKPRDQDRLTEKAIERAEEQRYCGSE